MVASGTDQDARFMAAALALARRGLGRVWPNPAVACLIVDETSAGGPRVIARGWTGEGGRPHAETIALEHAGAQARGATAYVTLEPCAHHGQTPPCAEALIAAGVARVVSAAEDPDPRVSGRGHASLRAAGIAVDVGCLGNEALLLNEGFCTRIALGRPHVTLKLALSRDGMIAAAPGQRTAITGERAAARVHMMRALADAVLVGAGTWRADDPQLTCRLPGLEERSPVRVILDARCELAPGAALLSGLAAAPLWIIADPGADRSRRGALTGVGAELIDLPTGADGRLDVAEVMRALGGRGITRLLVEAGAGLAESLWHADLADEVVIFEAAHDLGPGAVAAPPVYRPSSLENAPSHGLVSRDRLGPDTMLVFARER